MTTRVYLVRHGATVLSAEDAFAGETDVALSEEGREQARSLAARLAGEPIAAFYASPMSRTMETARILAAPHRLEVQPRDGLREISHGHWEGRKRAEVEKLFPEEYARWEADPFSSAPSGGESGLAVTARALPVLLRIVALWETSSARRSALSSTICKRTGNARAVTARPLSPPEGADEKGSASQRTYSSGKSFSTSARFRPSQWPCEISRRPSRG